MLAWGLLAMFGMMESRSSSAIFPLWSYLGSLILFYLFYFLDAAFYYFREIYMYPLDWFWALPRGDRTIPLSHKNGVVPAWETILPVRARLVC